MSAPAKPPPLPPKPAHLAERADAAPAAPPPCRAVPQRKHEAPPDYCARCGVAYTFGSAATSERKAGEPSVVDGMERVAVFQIAAGEAHGALLAGGKRAGLYLWGCEGSDVARPILETAAFGSTRLQHVACGGALTAVVSEGGQLFVWSQSSSSAAEDALRVPVPRIPTLVNSPKRLGKVACGKGHVLALAADGTSLVAWGVNDHGQLGRGPSVAGGFHSTAEEVTQLNGKALTNVSAGCRHSAVLTRDGHVYTFGSNAVGQCGVPVRHFDCLRSPHLHQEPCGSTPVRDVACGHYHTLILSHSGDDILACGLNKNGQLGNGSLENGEIFLPVEKAPDLLGVVAIGAGLAHSVAVTAKGLIFAWGQGSKGQVGAAGLKKDVLTPRSLMSVSMGASCRGLQAVACAPTSTFVLTCDDTLTHDNNELFPSHAPLLAPAPPLQVLTCTWNVNNTSPSPKSLEWLRDVVAREEPGIVVVGLQEVDLKAGALMLDAAHQMHRNGKGALAALKLGFKENKSLGEVAAGAKHGWLEGAKKRSGALVMIQSERGEQWREAIKHCLGGGYVEMSVRQMVGVMLGIFVRKAVRDVVRPVFSCSLGVGLAGTGGNKGAVGASLRVYESDVCFITAHLAAHDGHAHERNEQFHEIAAKLFPLDACSHALGHDHVVFCGDLNYRLGAPRELVDVHVRYRKHDKMMEVDELCAARAAGQAFADFHEMPVDFNPTFKFDVGSDSYDTSKKRRTPAYCDRVLWKNGASWSVGVSAARGFDGVEYAAVANCRESDHRPVYCRLRFEGAAAAADAARASNASVPGQAIARAVPRPQALPPAPPSCAPPGATPPASKAPAPPKQSAHVSAGVDLLGLFDGMEAEPAPGPPASAAFSARAVPPSVAPAAPSVDDLLSGGVAPAAAPRPAGSGDGYDLLGIFGDGLDAVGVQPSGGVMGGGRGAGGGGEEAANPGGWVTFDSTPDNPFGDSDPFASAAPFGRGLDGRNLGHGLHAAGAGGAGAGGAKGAQPADPFAVSSGGLVSGHGGSTDPFAAAFGSAVSGMGGQAGAAAARGSGDGGQHPQRAHSEAGAGGGGAGGGRAGLLTLADDPFAELTAQLNLGVSSQQDAGFNPFLSDRGGTAGDGLVLYGIRGEAGEIGGSGAGAAAARAGGVSGLNPFDMLDETTLTAAVPAAAALRAAKTCSGGAAAAMADSDPFAGLLGQGGQGGQGGGAGGGGGGVAGGARREDPFRDLMIEAPAAGKGRACVCASWTIRRMDIFFPHVVHTSSAQPLVLRP